MISFQKPFKGVFFIEFRKLTLLACLLQLNTFGNILLFLDPGIQGSSIPEMPWKMTNSSGVRAFLKPNKIKGGYKIPKAFLNAYHFVFDEVWIIKPSCKFVF